jgi:RNA polymerase sigma factor (sigma-70 family)
MFARWLFAPTPPEPPDGDRERNGTAADRSARVTLVPDHPDAQLVARIRQGDPLAFETLFREHAVPVRRAAYAIVRDAAAAEDVVQDVFVWLWHHRADWNPNTGIRPYLYGAVRRRALSVVRLDRNEDRRRAEAALRGDPDAPALMGHPEPLPDVALDAEEVQTLVWRSIDALPGPRRAILALRWRERMSWEGIAESLGSTVIAVKRQHSRALATLRERIFPEGS